MSFLNKINRRQRGSVVITTAIAMSSILISLIGVELGYLFFMKRELQKTADFAALAGAKALTDSDCLNAKVAAKSNADIGVNSNMPKTLAPLNDSEIKCGRWTSAGQVADSASRFTEATSNLNAVRIQITRAPDTLLAFFTGNRTIVAQAIAAKSLPAALLTIRSTLLSVDTTQSPILNSVFGGMLGGSINLDAANWDGLVKSDINLITYLDALAVRLGVGAGQYEVVLNTDATAGQLLQAAVDALTKDESANGAISVLEALVSASANVSAIKIQLAQLLGVQSPTMSSALDTTLHAFQLAEGIVQLANGKSAIHANTAIDVVGLAGITVATKVIEPPQFSSIGNPELAKFDPTGPNRIYVRTAQTRSIISVNINSSLATIVSDLATAVVDILSPVTGLLNNLLALDLVSSLADLSCVIYCEQQKKYTDIKIMPSPIRLDINLEVAAGSAYVNDYSCSTDESKSLAVQATTSAASLRIGKIGSTPENAITIAFSSKSPPEIASVPLIDIGTLTVKKSCTLAILCSTVWKKGSNWVAEKSQADRTAYAGGGVALKTDIPLLASSSPLTFRAPLNEHLPEIHDTSATTAYQTVSSQNIVNSLSNTFAGATIEAYKPSTSAGLFDVLPGVGSTFDKLIALLQKATSSILSPLLDPIVNYLLSALGINLSKIEVGARMSCSRGAELVY